MSKSIPIGRKLLAFLLALATILSLVSSIPVSAETLSDGQASYVTIKLNETHYVLETQGGTKLQGQSWTYTSDTGITGPAYCINWGLAIPSTSTKMPISGRYTATPQTLGAFANGYPQRPLEDFIALNKDAHPILENLTRIEYVAATQAAVWATLGQLAIDGTEYTSGRDTLKVPTTDPSQLRAYEALMIILYNASFWDRPLLTGMHIRLGWTEPGNTLNIEDESGLAGAEQKGMYGIAKETIDGVEYYTRSFIASSATSTFKNGYTIDLRLENAPAGTILADANGTPLSSYEANGVTYWSVPTPENEFTNMNQNGSEYAGEFKVCIPVNGTPDSGNITFHASAVITQYDIYFANNSVAREQSFVIADPMYADMACTGSMTWAKVASPHGRLVVNKTDGMGVPLADAAFTLTGADGTSYEGTSDAAGQIVWENLDPSITYTLSETQVPAGYIKAEDVAITLTAGATTTVSVQNFTENTLRIRKIDAQNGNPLIGATFRIEQIDGSFVMEITTNHTGVIELTSAELPYGSYRISEKTAPEGYEPSGEVQTIDWDGAADVTLTFENVREMSFVIVKADAETGIPLGGVAFEIYKDGRLVTTVTTDTAGYATVSGLTEGYYEVKEVAAPEGYVLDSERHGIHLDPYDPATEADPILLITNSKKPLLTIEKLDANTHLPIRNVRFAVYKDTTLIGNYSTNIHGTIELVDLEPGTYTVQEIGVPEGYVLQDLPQSIELKAGQTATLTFFNPTKPGISILKVDAETGAGLENARFRIQGVDSSYLEEFVTDRNGEITLENLAPGVYEVSESEAPAGYIKSGEVRTFEAKANGNIQLVFANDRKPSLKLTKIDAATGDPLPGTVIRFTNLSGSDVFEMTTDENGEIYLTGLTEGIYTVQEITAPAGYLLDDTLHHVTVVAGENNALVLENDRKPSLTIKKYDSLTGEMMAGTTFEIYRDTTLVGVYTTDENGEIRLYDLATGTYTVQEIATDDDHIVNSTPQSIEITANSLDTALLVFLNDQKPYIRLVKLDSQTMQPLVNAAFTFKKVGSTFEKEYTTDENGEIKLDRLESGTYTVTETKAPDGYLIDDASRTVKIDGNEYATFVFTDTKKPSLKVLKYDKHNDKYLSGAIFRIAKIEDGSNYLDRITDIDGSIEIDNLDPGVYSVKEIKAPVGYVLNETEYHVELFPGKESQLVVLNEEKPNLRIVKTDAITGEPIAGVGFLVRLADGSTENTVVTDANGEALLTHLEPGVYEVIEKSVPNGYLLDSEPKLVTLIPNRTSVVRFENHPKPSLTVNKVDSITKDPLKNARFSVIYASNATFTGEINNLGTYTTDEKGQFKLYNLDDGWYKITEIAAPDGYEITASSHEIYIRGGENKAVTFENVPLSGLVIRKVDADTGEVLQGARFEVRYLSGTSGSGGTVIGEYTTSANGTIIINRLKAGTYVIEEIKAPDGYIISDAPETVYISGTEQDVVSVTFENKRDGGLIIRKLDSVTGEPLAGAEFTVTTSDGKFVGTDGGAVTSNGIHTTDATGQIHITGIEAGTTVVVTETKAPDGYVLDELSQTVKIDANDTQTLTFYNYPGTGLIIKKIDADSGNVLSGAKFRVRSLTDGAVIGDFTTGANGAIIIDSLKVGTYSIEEAKAPDGYIISDTVETVVITGNEKNAVTVTFENKRDGGLIIRKLDSVTGEPLAGAEFTVTTSDGKFVGTDGGAVTSNGIYTTDKTGQIHITEIEAGTTVVVTETKAPDGYVIDTVSKTVKIDANDTQTLTFYNHPSSGILITKLDSITEKPLAGAVFEVTDGSGAIVGTANGRFTTDINGIIKVPDLKPGTYIITEVTAPDGYMVDSTPQTIKVESGKVHNLLFYNVPASGIIITKLDSMTKSPLAGAVFEVKRGDGMPIGKYTTDANGMIHVTGLETGTYVVTEISAPDGYTADGEAQIVSVVSGKLQNLTFYNIPDGGIIVNKLDSVTNAPLSDAVFEVTDVTGAAVGRYTTDASGIIRVNGLKPGAYIVKEVAAPDGYTISGEAQSVTVVSGKHQSLTYYNAPDSTLVITKLDRITKEPLYGAVFEVTEASGAAVGVTGGRYSTDANGTIRITGIKPGAYVITEVAAPDGYTISGESQTTEIVAGKVYNLTFYNDPAGGLIITKLDRITKEPLYGAVFEVTDSSGAVVGKANGRYVTDANGVIRIRGLKPDTYVVTEVEAPDGYIAAPEPQTIKVVSGEIHNLTFYNSPSGALVITKLDKNTGEPLYGATFKITDSAGTVVGNRNGTYTTNLHGIIYIPELAADTYIVTEILAPDGYTLDGTPQTVKIKPGETHELVFVNEPLGGIRIIKLDEETRQPIKGVQYEVSHMNGERIGTFTTNASGVIVIDELENGWYTAVEVRAADGYIIDAEPHDIEVADGEITRVTLTNRKSSSFFIHKVDAATGKGIYGVTFLVSDRWGNPIAQYVTDQNGFVYMDDRQLEDGKYYIREIGVPSGYVIDPEIKTFYVEYGRTASITWYNLPIQAQIQLIKKSADDNPINGLPAGSLLEGAVFEIYDKAGNVVDTVTTDRNGRASSKPLPLGLYTIRETVAPMYYTANDTVMSAHLEFNEQIMTFEVLNKSVKLGVSVSKYGYNEVMPDNPLVYDFKNIANTSSVPLESFYFRDTLASAIRAEQLVTGTFNQPLSYKIVYLTNLSNGEYRTINDNLSTSRNYVIDISNVALGLAENEYLTEIMYVFGTVKAGFSQVESPQLYARSVKGLANGASFVNMADVGGIYNGQWITTISRWVTRVYSYTLIEMPKTGY